MRIKMLTFPIAIFTLQKEPELQPGADHKRTGYATLLRATYTILFLRKADKICDKSAGCNVNFSYGSN